MPHDWKYTTRFPFVTGPTITLDLKLWSLVLYISSIMFWCVSTWSQHSSCWGNIRTYFHYLPFVETKMIWEIYPMGNNPDSKVHGANMGPTWVLLAPDGPHVARFMGPTWGPPGSCRPQMGPMLVPWTFRSGKDMVILHSWYYDYWWPGNTRSQGISSHGIDLFHKRHSVLSTRRVQWYILHDAVKFKKNMVKFHKNIYKIPHSSYVRRRHGPWFNSWISKSCSTTTIARLYVISC